MTTVSKTISSNKQYQLVDLNGELVNFKIDYMLESIDSKPFETSIVSQEHLDDNRPIKYKKSENGKILGSMENKNNMKDNYYIAIKSDEEVEVNVTITRTEIPAPTTEMDFELKEKKNSFMYKYGYIIFIVIMLIGFGVYYYMYIYNPTTSVSKPDVVVSKIDTVDVKSIQVDDIPKPDVNISASLPKLDNKSPTPPPLDTKSYTPVSSIHSVRSSEASSPGSERSDISEGCKNAINELMSKCVDL